MKKTGLEIIKYHEDEEGLYLDTVYGGCSVTVDKETGDVLLNQGSEGYNSAFVGLQHIVEFNSLHGDLIVVKSKNSDGVRGNWVLGIVSKKDKLEALEWIEKCNELVRRLKSCKKIQ